MRTDRGVVSGSSSAYRVDSSQLLCSGLAGSLTLEFLIEGEGCAFRVVVNVACSSSSGRELGAGLRNLTAEEVSWAMGVECIGCFWGLEGIACSAAAGVGVGTNVWVRLGDFVGRHFDVVWRTWLVKVVK